MGNTSFFISTDKTKLDRALIYSYLSEESYWARGIPENVFLKSVEHSLCFGVYAEAKQAGFARVTSDFATFAYLADVFILKDYRGLGLSKMLMESIMSYPDLKGLRRWVLATADAHGIYASYGFKALAKPERWMEKHDPDVYKARAF